MNSPLAYSIPETCVLANCSRTALYQKISSGELRAVKCGRRTLVLADDLPKWIHALPAIDVKSSGQTESQVARCAQPHDDDRGRRVGHPQAKGLASQYGVGSTSDGPRSPTEPSRKAR
jgi:excisionase family DNA binding protein